MKNEIIESKTEIFYDPRVEPGVTHRPSPSQFHPGKVKFLRAGDISYIITDVDVKDYHWKPVKNNVLFLSEIRKLLNDKKKSNCTEK